jgi:rSAM/selenodomain-associated transferase 1
MKEALIIFVRPPEPGKVKTRLAAQIGAGKAVAIYQKLLAHTKSVVMETSCDAFVFTTETLQDDYWNDFMIEQQSGNDLGEKMLHAFDAIFNKGYEKVLIIGSDCPQLSPAHIVKAFQGLDDYNVVIGSAKDGGYYLLGMKTLTKELFKNKSWSTSSVFQQTLDTLRQLDLSCFQLETLTDVDEVKDVPAEWLAQLSSI